MLAALIFASLVAHFGFVAWLHHMDWPKESDIPDQYWTMLPPAKFTPPPKVVPAVQPRPMTHVATTVGGGGGGGGPKHGPRGPGRVAHISVVEALGGSAMHDFLKTGSDENVFDKVGGVTVGDAQPALKGQFEFGRNHAGGDIHVRGPGGVVTGERGGERAVEPGVRVQPPKRVQGGLPVADILATIKERIGAMRACYEGPLNRDHDLAGKLTLRLLIAADGSVESVDFEEDTLGSAQVTGCVRARVGGWRFPPAPRPSLFSFPVVFQGERT
jgi:hypothetical protein